MQQDAAAPEVVVLLAQELCRRGGGGGVVRGSVKEWQGASERAPCTLPAGLFPLQLLASEPLASSESCE